MALFRREPSARRAEKLVSRGKIEAAIKEYRRLLDANPEDTGTLNLVGDLYARVNKYAEAIDLYRQTADRFVDEGFYVKAIAVYKKIHRLDSNQLDVYEKLAGLYSVQGLVKDARTQYEVLVDYYESNGKLNSAVEVCQQIVELEPQDPGHRTRLAELYERLGDLGKVVAEYLEIARVMLDHGRIEKATQVLERALEVNPFDVGFLVEAVGLLRLRSQDDFAAEFLGRAEAKMNEAGKGDLFLTVVDRVKELPAPVSPVAEEESAPATAAGAARPADAQEPIEDADGALVLEPPEELLEDLVGASEGPSPESAEEITLQVPEAGVNSADLLAEVDVFIKYGFREKALDRLGEVIREYPDAVPAYRHLVELLLEDRSYRAVMEAANRMSEAVSRSGDSEGWLQIRQRLADEGFLVEGDEIKAVPAVVEQSGDEIDLLEPTGANLQSIIDSAHASSSATSSEQEVFVLEVPEEVEDLEPGPATPPATTEVSASDDGIDFVVVDDDFADLEDEVSREMESGTPVESADTPSLEEIVESFKQGVAENLSSEDFDTHYNLGIAYREMGLLDEAIGEFEISSRSPDYFIGSCSLMGLCFRDKGDVGTATSWYQKGLRAPELSPEEKMSLLYDLADNYETSGDRDNASSTFAELQTIDGSYRDVEQRLAALQ